MKKKKSSLESELLSFENQLLDLEAGMGSDVEVKISINKNKIKLLGAKKK